MNPHKYFVSADLMNNPLYGIETYKDIINLATGQITKNIKKFLLTGEENWLKSGAYPGSFYAQIITKLLSETYTAFCSHLSFSTISQYAKGNFCFNGGAVKNCNLWFNQFDSSTTVADLKSYLAQQYLNGTPVTLWYVLAESEADQITVPSGLSGTVEGYLIQDGTPTPEAPIYPTANTAKGWYNINAYKRSVLTWNTDTAYERSDGSWT